jgi:hypothetical protein
VITNSLKKNEHSRHLKIIICLLAIVVISCFAVACGSSVIVNIAQRNFWEQSMVGHLKP